MNKVIIIGNLGEDVKLSYTQAGTVIAAISIATSESFKDAAGRKQEKTSWHRVKAFGKTAELCSQYLKKGSQVMVDGKISYNEFTNKEGNKVTICEIVANNVQFL